MYEYGTVLRVKGTAVIAFESSYSKISFKHLHVFDLT